MIALVSWTDDPLSSANNARGVYLQEMQTNANFVREQASIAQLQWTNASAGRKFVRAHVDELTSSLEDPTLLSFYGFTSITDAIGRSWSALPGIHGKPSAGYALLNDIRNVIDAMIAVENPDHAFALVVESSVTRDTPFDLIIQSYDTTTGEDDTDYVPASAVSVWLENINGETIVPIQIGTSGWANGGITVSCTITGGEGNRSILIHCRDVDDFRTGTVSVAVGTASDISYTSLVKMRCRQGAGGHSEEAWIAAWLGAQEGTGTCDDGTAIGFLGCDFYAYGGWGCVQKFFQYSCYGANTYAEFGRTYMNFDISAEKGTVLAARIRLDGASDYFAWDDDVDTNAHLMAVSVYSTVEDLVGATDAAKYQNLLSMAQNGTYQGVRSFASLKTMVDSYGQIWFTIDPDTINEAGDDFLRVVILGWQDRWNQRPTYPGTGDHRRPYARYDGTPVLEVVT